MRCCAVPQVQIDQALIRNADLLRDCLEVRDGLFVEPNGDLLLELCCVWILPRSGEVVLFSHVVPLQIKLGFLGRRLASGDDANDVTFAPIAVTDKQQATCFSGSPGAQCYEDLWLGSSRKIAAEAWKYVLDVWYHQTRSLTSFLP